MDHPAFDYDPTQQAASDRLEELWACIGPIDDRTVAVELIPSGAADEEPKVNDANIGEIVECVNAMGNVSSLDISESAITDAAMPDIARLATVESLVLSNTAITDAGLDHITQLPQLTGLVLSGTSVTDRGLTRLSKLKRLEFLQLFDTTVSYDACEELEIALPELSIEI